MSCSRHSAIYKASDGNWYLELADREDGEREDSYAYGPFPDQGAAEQERDRYVNAGGTWLDESGLKPPPLRSPNGEPLQSPTSEKRERPIFFRPY